MNSISAVLSQHADGASFLWELRCAAASAPHYSLADLAKLDNRLEANLDGLRVAGDAGWELCQQALKDGQAGEVFAAAVLAFESNKQDRVDLVLQSGSASAELSRGLISGLGWLPWQQAEPHIARLLTSPLSTAQRVGIAASAIHRHNPGRSLLAALSSVDVLLRARALRAVGELGLIDLLSEIQKYLNDDDALCRFSAAWSTILLSSHPGALAILVSTAESDLHYREKALQIAARRMDHASATAWFQKLAANPNLIHSSIALAGALGDPANMPWLIEQMGVPELSRLAGEAFTTITGIDIALEKLERKPPESSENEESQTDADENLPWPEPDRIATWWNRHQGTFRSGARYLLGRPISVDSCRQVLRAGRQRQSAAAALELAIRDPGQPLFNVAAPGHRQQRELGLRH